MATLDPLAQAIALRRAGGSVVDLGAGSTGPVGPPGPPGPQGEPGPAGESLLNADGGAPNSVYGGIPVIDGGSI